MTQILQPLGGDTTVLTRDSGASSFSDALDVARLADGSYVAVWDNDGDNAIQARLLDAGGAPASAIISVSRPITTPGGAELGQWGPTVTGLADGGFMVAWTAEEYNYGYNTGRNVEARLFNADGSARGAPFAAVYRTNADGDVVTSSWEYNPSLTQLADGRVAMAYEAEGDVHLRLYAPDGIAIQDTVTINTLGDGYHSYPEVKALETGGWVVVWEEDGVDGSGSGTQARLFAADGSAVGPEWTVNTDTYSGQISPEVTALAGGGFVVSWFTAYDEAQGAFVNSARAQIYDAAGNPVGGEFELSEAFEQYGSEHDIQLAALPDGGFVAAFTHSEYWTTKTDVYAQVFDGQGNMVGETTMINAGTEGYQDFPRLFVDEDGTVTFLWVSDTDDTDAILSRSFRLGEFDGTPTAGDDAIALSDGGHAVNLLAGDDWLQGGSGADTVTGGSGDDTIAGGAGNDVIDGGAGADLIDGGEGRDIVRFYSATRSVRVDLQNAQYMYGDAVGDRYSNVEIFMTGNTVDQLRGDAEDNIFFTGGLSDRLYGRQGDDRLFGQDGADAFYGGMGADTMTGGDQAGRRDRYIYFNIAESGVGAGDRDVITDFVSGEDRIEIRRFDADVTQGNKQYFDFVGDDGLSGTAGELAYLHEGGNTIVQADVDGDGAADFEIELTGIMELTADDFLI